VLSTSTDGDLLMIEHEDKRAYVSWMDVEISNATRKVTLEQLRDGRAPLSP
jgi:hypothetical protein